MATDTLTGGHFDFEAVITNLFKDDIGPGFRAEKSKDRSRQELNERGMKYTAYYANRKMPSLVLNKLPADLPQDIDAALFHERIHFWQMISCPLQQYRYLIYLEELRTQLAAAGGNPEAITGVGLGLVRQEVLREEINNISANFAEYDMNYTPEALRAGALPEVFEKVRLKGRDWVTPETGEYAYLPTAQLFLLFPRSGTTVLPGYGAEFSFDDHDTIAIVPFTGRYLMESAAHLSQLLYEKKPLEKPSNLDSHRDKLYLGVFEFWRRLHGHRYDNEEDLVLSFLAAVDLAISSDAVDIRPSDGEFHYEMLSIPYRFGKLAFRIQGIEPLKRQPGEEPSLAVANFQQRICQYNNWPSPDFTTKKMAIELSRVLIIAHASFIPYSKEGEALLTRVIETPLTEQAKHFEDIQALWELFYSDKHPRLGQAAVGTMLNACIYKINHPGEFALPHIYHQQIKDHFPLPCVFYNGDYYYDNVDRDNTTAVGYPYPVQSVDLAHDAIFMMTSKPLRSGNAKQCGFLTELIDCWYIKSGLGCPLLGFKADQAKLRKSLGMDDWCHYTFQSIMQKTAAGEVMNRWKAKWDNYVK